MVFTAEEKQQGQKDKKKKGPQNPANISTVCLKLKKGVNLVRQKMHQLNKDERWICKGGLGLNKRQQRHKNGRRLQLKKGYRKQRVGSNPACTVRVDFENISGKKNKVTACPVGTPFSE